jgi:hypothetical protein
VSRLLQQSVWWTAQRRQGEHTGSRRRPWCTVRCAPTACLCGRSRAWGGLLRMMADAGGTTCDDLDERVGTSRTDGAGCRRRRRRQRNTALHDTARRDTAHDWPPVEGEEMDAAAAEQDYTGRLRRGTSCCMSQTARFTPLTPHASRLTLPHTHDQPAASASTAPLRVMSASGQYQQETVTVMPTGRRRQMATTPALAAGQPRNCE